MSHNYLLAIPVYNEQDHVQGVLEEARRYADEVLVIDDGSTDSTGELLASQSRIHTIRHHVNLGYGRSLADSFRFAIQDGYDWLITMDCDEQHEPAAIPRFLGAIELDDADIISGSRYMEVTADGDAPPPERRQINQRITEMIKRRLGLPITDAFCGFKAYRVSALEVLHITEDGYAMPLQLWVQAARAELRIRELPIRLVYNDPNRHFGGELDDPTVRYGHYMSVFDREMSAPQNASRIDRSRCVHDSAAPSAHLTNHGCCSI